jgi:restriction endonuclease S subunit
MVGSQVFLVEKNEIEDRLDVPYFFPNVKERLTQLYKLSPKLFELQDLCETINRGKQPKYFEEGEIPVIKTVDIEKNGAIDWENVKFTDTNFFDDNLLAQFKEGDILLTSTGVGSLGKISIINQKREGVVDGHITIIRLNSKIAIPKFIYIFLRSELGKIQIERKIRGSTGQIEIYPSDIKTILVPLPSLLIQNKIINLYEEFDKKRKEIDKFIFNFPAKYSNLIEEGYEKIMDFLEIKYPKIDEEGLLLIIPSSKIDDRLDFMYYKKDCTKMISEIKLSKTPDCQLKDMVEFRKEKVDIKNNLDTTFNYSAISDIDHGHIHSFTPLTGRELPSRAKNIVKSGDILMPLLWTSREKVAIVQRGYDNLIVSTGFAVGKPKENISLEYLYIMLKSKYLQKQIEQRNTGGVMESISISELGKIHLPCPEINLQRKCLEIFKKYKDKADSIKDQTLKLKRELKELEFNFENEIISLLNR